MELKLTKACMSGERDITGVTAGLKNKSWHKDLFSCSIKRQGWFQLD